MGMRRAHAGRIDDLGGKTRSPVVEDDAEEGAPAAPRILPESDILIHCGDYQIDAGTKPRNDASVAFDRWLAAQPCTSGVRIICRGNHDHMGASFPASGATYVVRPTVIEACGLSIGIVPFSRGRLREPLPPCDVLVTHVPPRGILDKCYSGDLGGSRFLKEAVCQNIIKPRLWLCGHIHEGYGFEVVRFGSDDCEPTLVVNAANANTGKANKLCRAPVVVEIPPLAEPVGSGPPAEVAEQEALPKAQRRLLAVDLGLRTGVALFDGDGLLLRCAQYPRVEDAASLGDLAEEWLAGGPPHACEGEEPSAAVDGGGGGMTEVVPRDRDSDAGAPPRLPVTHLAIEGRDVMLRDEWDAAALRTARRLGGEARGVRVARRVDVSPEAWRADLLLPKERKSGVAAKAAARLVARQIVAEHSAPGCVQPEKLPTDAAEAVLAGYHAVRQLGWRGSKAEPAVKRYTNGAVVLPSGSGVQRA